MNNQQTETPAYLGDEGLTARDGRYRVEKGEHHDRIYLYEPEFTHDEALRGVAASVGGSLAVQGCECDVCDQA